MPYDPTGQPEYETPIAVPSGMPASAALVEYVLDPANTTASDDPAVIFGRLHETQRLLALSHLEVLNRLGTIEAAG